MDRRTFLAATASVIATSAHADDQADRAETDLYAALSLIGDSFSVITYHSAAGSNLDQNLHASVPMTDAALDKLALLDVSAALKKALPSSSLVELLATTQPSLFKKQDALFSDSKLLLPDGVAQAIKDTKARRLILLTKYRSDAWLQARHTSLGSGKLEGVGFYIDRVHGMRRADTGEAGRGFIAPFVYVRVWLIDVPTFTVIRSEEIMTGTTIAASRNENGVDPWGALSDAQKMKQIQHLLKRELSRVVPLLVADA